MSGTWLCDEEWLVGGHFGEGDFDEHQISWVRGRGRLVGGAGAVLNIGFLDCCIRYFEVGAVYKVSGELYFAGGESGFPDSVVQRRCGRSEVCV